MGTRGRAFDRAGPGGKDGAADWWLGVAGDMFRAPDSEGGRAGPRCGAGVGTVMWRACGRRGGRGELTEPGPPRRGEGGGRGCGPGRPEVRLPAPSAPARAAPWAGAPQTPAERSLAGGGRGGAAGTLAPCGVCASGRASRRSPFLGARRREPAAPFSQNPAVEEPGDTLAS